MRFFFFGGVCGGGGEGERERANLLVLLAPGRFTRSHLNDSATNTPYISRAKDN